MSKTLELSLEDGGSVAVEIAGTIEDSAPRQRFGPDDEVADKVAQSFDSALASLSAIAGSLHTALREVVNAPDTVTVEFGIHVTASAGVVIASGSGGANLNISMEWKRGE